MKKIISITIILCLFAQTVFAGTWSTAAKTVAGETGLEAALGTHDDAADYVKAGASIGKDVALETAAPGTAVKIASATGATAQTGTEISTLSGAAAMKATMAKIGRPVLKLLKWTKFAPAPAKVGMFLAVGGAWLLGWAIDEALDD